MNSKLVFTAALLAACPLALHAQAVPAPPAAPTPVTLRFQFKPGVSRAYAVVMDVNGTILTGQSGAGIPISQHWEMTLRQTVQDVRASDGAATIVTGITALTIRVNGKDTVLPQSKLSQLQDMTTTVVTPTGKTLSTVLSPLMNKMVGGVSGGANPTGLIETLFTLPAGPIRVGDTWHGSESAAAASAAPTSAYILKSLEVEGGIPTAHIGRTLDGNLTTLTTKAPRPMKIMSRTLGTGDTEFDTQDGTVLRQEATGTAVSTLVIKSTQAGAPLAYKMQLQTKIDVSQLFSVAVPTSAPAQ